MISWGIQLYKSWGICGHPGVNPHRSSGATLRSTKPWFLKGSTNFDSTLNHFGIFWGPQNWLGNWRFVNLGVELDISKKDLPTSPSPTAFQRTWCYHHWNKKSGVRTSVGISGQTQTANRWSESKPSPENQTHELRRCFSNRLCESCAVLWLSTPFRPLKCRCHWRRPQADRVATPPASKFGWWFSRPKK